ncbi:hypothetical protein SAMN04488069_12032 [Hymenobacter psychrophilus]|uniref:Uncharacterized protein n=1 Tax=Hymenobacter psychrophilus TaxID=651662 RepID=A0A1H3P0P4_9BACT|nr:hypothetical protein SAMN04488069_12032 [Hymenobacter psychrophilus]
MNYPIRSRKRSKSQMKYYFFDSYFGAGKEYAFLCLPFFARVAYLYWFAAKPKDLCPWNHEIRLLW